MMNTRDWRDTETTVYVNLSATIDDQFSIRTRGGKHYGFQNCEGFAYKTDIYFSGNIRMAKEQFHERFFYTDIQGVTGSIEDKWIGIKFCVYNSYHPDSSQKQGVILETHLDINANNNWQKVYSYADYGGWGNQGTVCNGDPDQIGLWGSPIVAFVWNNVTRIDLKWLSIREIDPYGITNEGGSNFLAAIGIGGHGLTGSGSKSRDIGGLV